MRPSRGGRRRRADPSRSPRRAGAPTRNACTAGSSSSRKRSSTLRSTRMRLRAQQSWPALSKTAPGAVAAARSRSESANTMLALLPPSSRVDGLTCSAHPAATRLPTSVDPVKTILRTFGCVTKRSPTTEPRPGSTWNRCSGRPDSSASSPSRMRGQRRPVGGLQQHGVAGGERGREPPRRDRHREVPRHDHADDAERLVEGDVEPAGDRDLLADQPLGRAGVVVQDVADVPGLPARRADRMS